MNLALVKPQLQESSEGLPKLFKKTVGRCKKLSKNFLRTTHWNKITIMQCP